MENIKELIKDYAEDITGAHKNTFNYRVEQVGENNYGLYIINSFADIEYSFSDVQEDEDGYSAIVDMVYCKINESFSANSDTDYYVDGLNRYIENCEIVADILDSIDVYRDGTRTYF